MFEDQSNSINIHLSRIVGSETVFHSAVLWSVDLESSVWVGGKDWFCQWVSGLHWGHSGPDFGHLWFWLSFRCSCFSQFGLSSLRKQPCSNRNVVQNIQSSLSFTQRLLSFCYLTSGIDSKILSFNHAPHWCPISSISNLTQLSAQQLVVPTHWGWRWFVVQD